MRRRVIDELRRSFPGAWRYDPVANRWNGPDFSVEPRSHLAPRYDGDDDSFVTVYYRSDTQVAISLGLMAFDLMRPRRGERR